MIDYTKAVTEFNNFLKQYDTDDGKIRLKIVHTFKVVDLSERIARTIGLSEEEVQLAKLIGLLHDIGRFEQIRQYGTFVDGKSVNHALLGVQILENNDYILNYCEKKYVPVVLCAISNHNRFRIEGSPDQKTLTQCRIIRDADKTDIFRVRIEDPVADALPCDQKSLEESGISDKVFSEFMQGHEIHKEDVHTPLDIWVMGLAFIYDYNYSCALKILEESGYIDRQIDRITYRNPDSCQKMEQIRYQCHAYIEAKVKQS